MSGDYHIHLADGSGQVYDSKEAANKDAKLLRSMYKEWSAKRPKTKGPATKKSTPTKVDAGKSVMNLPTKEIPAYPVKSKWGRMSARQIKDAKSIMGQTGVSQKEAIKSVMNSNSDSGVKPKRRKRVTKKTTIHKG